MARLISLVALPLLLVAALVGQGHCSAACYSTLSSCTHTLFTEADMAVGADIEALCASASRYDTCMGDCINMAALQTGLIRGIYDMLQYTCEPSRRSTMARVLVAPCLQNEEERSQMSGLSTTCLEEEMTRVGNLISIDMTSGENPFTTVCPSRQNIATCMGNRMREFCGEDVVGPVEDLTMIFYQHFLPEMFSCETGIVRPPLHYIAKRAASSLFELLKRKFS